MVSAMAETPPGGSIAWGKIDQGRSQTEKTERGPSGDISKIRTFYLAKMGKVRIIPKVRKMASWRIAKRAEKAYNL
jgi:hypothetical protein